MSKISLALCQMKTTKDKTVNLKKAKEMIIEASNKGANIIALPEMFNCPYDYDYFREFAEMPCKSETLNMLKELSKKHRVVIIGGSIPEIDFEGNLYNTSFVLNEKGEIAGRHRKVHLFDINIKGKIEFYESKFFNAGNEITIVDTPWCKLGLAICYDIRFPEIIRLMALKGAQIIFVPAAFNNTTGPVHWELLFRARAVDNQLFMAGISPAKNEESSYKAYGHSLIVNPWGDVISQLGYEEDILIEEISLDDINTIREQLPLLKHRRKDIYILNDNL